MKPRDRAAKILARNNRLKEIYDQNDKVLTAAAVVADAQSPSSPLHSFFEWDDVKAGHLYRLEQARAIIRSVHIKTEYTEHTVSSPYYVQDTRQDPKDGGGYKTIDDLKSDEEHSREVLHRRLKSLQTEMEQNRHLAEALGITGDFELFIDHISRMRTLTDTAA